MGNGTRQYNCVVTLKYASKGTPTYTPAYLQPQGGTRSTDAGNFLSYAGPVARSSPSCVYWGGSASGVSSNSPLEDS